MSSAAEDGGIGDPSMLKLDIGCGAYKRSGFIGIDLVAGGAVDVCCDIVRERLPFDDESVEHVFSSHCLEHIDSDNIPHVLKEMIRVAANDALIEIWHPYAFHYDAFILGHKSYLTEEQYVHFCGDNWLSFFGSSLAIEEIRYHIEGRTLATLRKRQIDLEFAIDHLQNVVKEIGIYLRVGKPRGSLSQGAITRAICSEGPDLSWLGERDNCVTVLTRDDDTGA
jgi:SAM-dependent methyltransferase